MFVRCLKATTYVSFALLISSCQSHSVISKPNDQLYCVSKEDCMMVEKVCGEKGALNAAHVQAFEKRVEDLRRLIDCNNLTGIKQQQGSEPACEANKCILK